MELGQKVTKGQVLATVESNESLQVFNVTAPISGTILKRNTNIGNLTSDEPMFTIVDLSKVWAKFHIFPKDTNQIKEGQSVKVHTLGNVEKEATSTIKMLLPTADALSQTYVAIVELDNENSDWRPGMTVEGDVAVSQENASIVIPTSAIQTMEDQTVVFVESKLNSSTELAARNLGAEECIDGDWTGNFDIKACHELGNTLQETFKTKVRTQISGIIDGASIPGLDPIFWI